jgi:hypothetical protein
LVNPSRTIESLKFKISVQNSHGQILCSSAETPGFLRFAEFKRNVAIPLSRAVPIRQTLIDEVPSQADFNTTFTAFIKSSAAFRHRPRAKKSQLCLFS